MKNSYDLYQNGKYIGTYTARVIAEICGIDNDRVCTLADLNRVFGDGYRCEIVDTIISKNEKLAAEWDKVRVKLLEVKKQPRSRKHLITVLDSTKCGDKKVMILCKVNLKNNNIIYSIADKTQEYTTTDTYKEAVKILSRMKIKQVVNF